MFAAIPHRRDEEMTRVPVNRCGHWTDENYSQTSFPTTYLLKKLRLGLTV